MSREDHHQQVINRTVPWIVSVMFHASLALILAFIVMLSAAESPDREYEVALGPYHKPGPPFIPRNKPKDRLPRQPEAPEGPARSKGKGEVLIRKPDSKNPLDPLPWKPKLKGKPTPPEGRWDRPIFDPGPPVPSGHKPAKHIVFVIDRSGSMVDTFPRVRVAILDTVGKMSKDQDFHVLLFSDGPPIENTPRRLVPATEKQKLDLVKFLKPIRATGRTDPLPALKRAFNVLRGTKDKDGRLIHLLTDGVFPDNDKVLALIRQSTAGTDIRINTYLCGYRPPAADIVMKKIALETKGVYKYVSLAE